MSAALEQGCDAALALTRFVPRAASGALGADAAAAQRRDWLMALAAEPWTRARLQAALAREHTPAPDPADPDARIASLARALRRLRRDVVVGTLVRDVAGVASLDEVIGAMTALAELSVQQAVAAHAARLAARHGTPCSAAGEPIDLLVVAMGKGGGGELNVSSDLDLVFVYDEDGETRGGAKPVSNHEFFERLGRATNALLADVTADGFVFRIDMRLRPHGESGPLVVSNAMLEEYLVRDGRTWERFAWLKGRVISAPVFADASGFARQTAALESIVRPFVFRKYLDFNAIAALRELHATIRAETDRKAVGREERMLNVKLGRGGIREIEFIAQTFQIMRGGREPKLAAAARSTRGTLALLPAIGALDARTCATLDECYEFLRRLEHVLQYRDDAQTHAVPAAADERAQIAQLLRLADGDELLARLAAVNEFVAATFDAVFRAQTAGVAAGGGTEGWSAETFTDKLRAAGFAQAEESAARVTVTMAGRRVAACPEASRFSIGRLLNRAVDGIAALARDAGVSHDAAVFTRAGLAPDDILTRFVRLIDAIAGRSTYLALLEQYPAAFARVLRLLAASGWATDYLARHPILLDELLDERALDGLDNLSQWARWADALRPQLAHTDDVEAQMNLLRDHHHAQTFRLLLADLAGRLTVERLADHLSALADQTLALALEGAWRTVPKRHRESPAYAVIGYGKYGGKELGYASDLDIVLLFDDAAADAPEVYAMLTRRLVNWLSAHTSSGVLFDIDLRLRPDGDKGLLFSSFDAFADYQRSAAPAVKGEGGKAQGAWTWEHQALTRARFCAGDAAVGAKFEALRAEILAQPRDRERLAADVLKMRQRMHDGHPNKSGEFDVKHDAGGMVDVEFVVQYLVLAFAHGEQRLLGNLGNIALLGVAGELGLIETALARTCADAYRSYRRVQHRLRMNESKYARVPRDELAAERAAVQALWRAVLEK
jgi:glutamate-ammonia-ligase adenylyltransferase